jgi:hypothetical protein
VAVESEKGVEPLTCGPSHSSQGGLFHGGVATLLQSEDLPMAVEPEKGVEPFTCGPSHSCQGGPFHGGVANFVTI